MKIAIIVSKDDPAGQNVKNYLISQIGFQKTKKKFDGVFIFSNKKFDLIQINDMHIYTEKLKELDYDFFIVASTHKNKSGLSELTVHVPGNWGKAELGGKDKTLNLSSSVLIRNYFEGLEKNRQGLGLKEFRVTLEGDHHGPTIDKGIVFIEFGGSEKEWHNSKAIKAVAETILNYTEFENKNNWIPAIGLGGNHYCDNFVKALQNSKYCFSHICPKYGLPEFDEKMLSQVLEKNLEKIQAIVIDNKGLTDKQRIKSLLKKTGLPIIKVKSLKKTKLA